MEGKASGAPVYWRGGGQGQTSTEKCNALAEDRAAHGADGEVSREGDEVRPGDGVTVLKLDRLKEG